MQTAGGVRQQHGHEAIEDFRDMSDCNSRHAANTARHRKFTAHRVEERGAPLPRPGNSGLLAHARHQIGDDQRDAQHDRESHEVLRI